MDLEEILNDNNSIFKDLKNKIYEESMIDEQIKKILELQNQMNVEIEKKYSSDLPNEVCKFAYIKGLRIENSFGPKVGELNFLFETELEKVCIWTHEKNRSSAIVIDVKLTVKEIPFWKNICSVIWLALQYVALFESRCPDRLEYRWLYEFDPNKKLEEIVFNNLDKFEKINLTDGRIIKATHLAEIAPEIELMLRDDKAYTSCMMLSNSFMHHYICLKCELSSYPYHDHLIDEPEIWEHANIIVNMETAIILACRSVEGILGEPPSTKNKNGVIRHKEKWRKLIGIEPDSLFEKAKMTYFDFYYKLFFELRNSSAHSYGDIHYNLERKKTVQAQCFALLILQGYIHKHILSLDEAKEKLHFNNDLLKKVNREMSTELTK